MSDRARRRFEPELARDIGTEQIPVTGASHLDGVDTGAAMFGCNRYMDMLSSGPSAMEPRQYRAHATMPRERFGTLQGSAMCARPECRRPFTPTARRHGSPRKFCSAHCRVLAWKAAHARTQLETA